MTDTITKSVEQAVAKTRETFEGFAKAQEDLAAKTSAQIIKAYDEIAATARANMDAAVTSGTVVAKGAEEAAKGLTAYAQAVMQDNIATGKALFGVKTIQELSEIQLGLAKRTLDGALAEANRLSGLAAKVTQDAAAPVAARVNAVARKAA